MTAPVPDGHLLLEGVVGSRAFGLDLPGSDTDYAGVWIEPTHRLLGLDVPVLQDATVKGRGDADATYHELAKHMKLCLACNPTAMELLWLPEYLHINEWGRELVGLRTACLSKQMVRETYMRYAERQCRKLDSQARLKPGDPRRAKHARHMLRLLWQGLELYTTGVLQLRVPDPDRFHTFGDFMQAETGASGATIVLEQFAFQFEHAASPLPEFVDRARFEDLLQRARRAYLADPPTSEAR